ncbi:hypothetical protein A7K94_0214300 [Modestobacter sp. VKM Ac-2676]|nr:hypothetical protein A7K94_0214300 [Modestobacter sp. VKM Ac-2676]
MSVEPGLLHTNGILRQPWVTPERTSAGLGWDRQYLSVQRAQPYRESFEVGAVVIGPGQEYDDLYGDWARVQGIEDGGALLLRPDDYVAFRHAASASTADAEAALEDALRAVLDRTTVQS